MLMQLGHVDVDVDAFEMIWDRVAQETFLPFRFENICIEIKRKKLSCVRDFIFGGLGCPSSYWKWSHRVRGVARLLNNKSDICGHLSKGKDIDGIAIGKIAIRILQWGILPHFQYLESLADMHPTVFCLENLLTSCALVHFHKAHQH